MPEAITLEQQPAWRLTLAAKAIGTSPTLAINQLVAQKRAAGESVIHLGFGEASFPLPPPLSEALIRSARSAYYAPVSGIMPLRQAIAAYLQKRRALDVEANDIIVAPGSKPLLYALLRVLDGDLLLPEPSWVSYEPQAKLAGKRVFRVATDETDRHRLTVGALCQALFAARQAGGDPRLLVVNSPNNPTGAMFDSHDVQLIADWAKQNCLTLISDEIYAETAHGWRSHVSPAIFYPQGTIVTGGISKAFSAGGWRLGYAALPAGSRTLGSALEGLASEVWSAASTPVQEAAIAAFSGDAEMDLYVQTAAGIHAHLANRLQGALTDLGIGCPRPAGGFYLYADCESFRQPLYQLGITTSDELAAHLLNRHNIACLPGRQFGDDAQRLCLRLSTSMLFDASGPNSEEQRAARFSRVLLQVSNENAGHGRLIMPDCPLLDAAIAGVEEFARSVRA